ncbi:MAG: SemiSWEET transporter [Reichenbachiella sp.]|uniref:SemiSWEET transporter n=2 Tax=Reichenbachiella sp. TaxID=2184521 RepID=UPI003264CEDD
MQSLELWFGYLAVGLTISSFVPQVWRSIRTRSVRDLSIWTLIIFVCSSSCWLTYGILIQDVPIILTNTIIVILQITLLYLKIQYRPGKVNTRIEHVAFWVKNLEHMADFYASHFSATKGSLYTNPSKRFSSYFLSFKNSDTRIELMHNPEIGKNQNSKDPTYGLTHLALSVGSTKQVEALTEKCRISGLKVITKPRTTGDGYYESVILDPEGNCIELTA